MSINKQTVEKYMEGFRRSDHEMILSCLTDDISWEVPGHFSVSGKEAFDNEIDNENFTGSPSIQILRLLEEDNVVVAEGAVQSDMTNGGKLDAVFCDVFVMRDGKICAITSYLMTKN
jgi:ketosteroid isomerase-like protein